jgi:twinkle protein
MIDSKKLNALLLQNITRLCQELFPEGKMEGAEWCVGDLYGGQGKSLKINTKKGIWKDFGDNTKDGDLISLFIRLEGDDRKAGMARVYSFLGLTEFGQSKEVKKVKTTFKKPKMDWEELDGPVYKYLTETRKIPEEILDAYEVKMSNHPTIGLSYVFLYRHPRSPDVCLAFYCALERDAEGKKSERRSVDGLDALFGIKAAHKGNRLDPSEIIITGGQIDAMSYAAQGMRAVSVPSGEGNMKWIEINWDWLQQFKTIYLSWDMDPAGRTAVEAVAGRLGMARCKIINLPHKDANECHQQGVDLYKALVCAEEIKPGVFQSAVDLETEVWEFFTRGKRSEQGIPFLGWTGEESIKFNFRPSELTVWTGMEGSGKSNGLYQMAAWLTSVYGEKVAMISLEEGTDVSLGLMTQHAACYPMNPSEGVTREQFNMIYRTLIAPFAYVYHHVGTAPVADVIQFAEYAVHKHGCSHIVIDSLARIDLDIEQNDKVDAFLNQIVETMNTTKAHFHLVAHARKGKEDEFSLASIPKKRDIKGSVNIPIVAFNVLAFWKNELKFSILSKGKGTDKYSLNEVAEWPDGYIAVRKQKATGHTGEYPIWYDQDTFRIRRSYHAEDHPYVPITRHAD